MKFPILHNVYYKSNINIQKYIKKGLFVKQIKISFVLYKIIMQDKKAIQLIEKIQKEISTKKYDFATIIEDLKKVREITMELSNPVLTKALRLSYEHLKENNAFLIEIPNDEPIDEESEIEIKVYSTENNLESFSYFLSLLLHYSKKDNLLDLKEYNKAFVAM